MNICMLQKLRKHLDDEIELTADPHVKGALDRVIRAVDMTIEDEARREAFMDRIERDFYQNETP